MYTYVVEESQLEASSYTYMYMSNLDHLLQLSSPPAVYNNRNDIILQPGLIEEIHIRRLSARF
jgi:hypothetical protein